MDYIFDGALHGLIRHGDEFMSPKPNFDFLPEWKDLLLQYKERNADMNVVRQFQMKLREMGWNEKDKLNSMQYKFVQRVQTFVTPNTWVAFTQPVDTSEDASGDDFSYWQKSRNKFVVLRSKEQKVITTYVIDKATLKIRLENQMVLKRNPKFKF